jgi:stage II sporulation protein D
MSKGLFVFLIFLFNSSIAENVLVNVFSEKKLQIIEVQPLNLNYRICIDNDTIESQSSGTIYQLVADDDSILFSSNQNIVRRAKRIVFFNGYGCTYRIKSVQPIIESDLYEGRIEFFNFYCNIKVLNALELEDYIAGVVEAEAGQRLPLEYYKVQSIICRTYILGHLRRHELEDYNVCDKEHCQVYKGKSMSNPDIQKGALLTKNVVLMDNDLNLITCAFHSNCGGETCNAEDVWNRPSFGLKSKKDSFCLKQRNAKWEKIISKEEWKKYILKKNSNLDSLDLPSNFSFIQIERKTLYQVDKIKIPLKEIRLDWGFKSTFFSIIDNDDKLLFSGKGFGHGIGLCQEGAINMAKQAFLMNEILHYYYKDVTILDLDKVKFFKEE